MSYIPPSKTGQALTPAYFATSRSRSPGSSSYLAQLPSFQSRRRGPRRGPPPPTVEDEEVSLAREVSASSKPSNYDPPLRGIVDQNPIILEADVTVAGAARYNPERTFLLLPKSDTYSPEGSDSEQRRPTKPTKTEPAKKQEASQNAKAAQISSHPSVFGAEKQISPFENTISSNQPASTIMSPNIESPENTSSTTLGSSSNSSTTTSESTIDDLSDPSIEDSDSFNDMVNEVLDDCLIGLSDIAMLALKENENLDQDLIHPLRHQERLRELLTTVCHGSVAAMSLPSLENAAGNRRSEIGPLLEGGSDIPEKQLQQSMETSLIFRPSPGLSRSTLISLQIEASVFVTRILKNIAELQKQAFCTNSINFLSSDSGRKNVAELRIISLDQIQRLASLNHQSGAPEMYHKQLSDICRTLFVHEAWTHDTTMSLRILDLIILSYAGAHVGAIDHILTSSTVDRTFEVFANGIRLEDHISPEYDSVVMARRKFRCLDGFFGQRSLWVFHSEWLGGDLSEPMYLSTTPEAFGDIWGPMWKITNPNKPEQILRFDLENGAVVPSQTYPNVMINGDEELCHWISHSEFVHPVHEHTADRPHFILKPKAKLLIGASDYSIHKNRKECFCNPSQVTEDFRKLGYLRESGTLKPRRQVDSIAIGTGFGGGGIGAPSLNVSVTTKIIAGRTLKEQIWKRWTNESPCNWHILLRYFGVEISFCTDNSRRRRLIDLLSSITMRNLMAAIYPFSDEDCRKEVDDILKTNPLSLLEIPKTRPQWREGIEKAIGTCLSFLYDTGTASGAKDPLRAFWVYENQEYIVQFPHEAHEWTRFVLDYDESCAFIILEEDCLVRERGRGCQHTEKKGKGVQSRRHSSVFETAIIPNNLKDLPEGMILSEKHPPHGKSFWDVSKLGGSKHKFRIGEHGKVTISKPCGNRALIGRWEAVPLFETGKRKFVSAVVKGEPPKFHFERLYDNPKAEVVPIKCFVLS